MVEAKWAAAASGSVVVENDPASANTGTWSNSSHLYGPQFAGRVNVTWAGGSPCLPVTSAMTFLSTAAIRPSAENGVPAMRIGAGSPRRRLNSRATLRRIGQATPLGGLPDQQSLVRVEVDHAGDLQRPGAEADQLQSVIAGQGGGREGRAEVHAQQIAHVTRPVVIRVSESGRTALRRDGVRVRPDDTRTCSPAVKNQQRSRPNRCGSIRIKSTPRPRSFQLACRLASGHSGSSCMGVAAGRPIVGEGQHDGPGAPPRGHQAVG